MITVNGIAGVFLYANDPKKLAEWYALHFGITFLSDLSDTYYREFYHRDDMDSSKRWNTVYAIMPAKQPLGPERGEYLIHFRVDDLRGCLDTCTPIRITFSLTRTASCSTTEKAVTIHQFSLV